MSNVITLYDIPAASIKDRAWSPNTWKARFALNIKGIPYKTVWLEYTEIEPALLKLGAKATDTKPDGRPHYTLPVIHDPSTNAVVSDSYAIAEYLDAQYPDTIPLFPKGSAALQAGFVRALQDLALSNVWVILLPATHDRLNPGELSQDYFRRTREARFGKTLEELCPEGKERKETWGLVRRGWSLVDGWFKKNRDGEGDFVIGKEVTFVDVFIVSFLLWFKLILGEDSEAWKSVLTWDEGRWGKMLEAFEKWQVVV
ncbi:hypothetical protein JAAARDRAFT_199937 [Jaapia argillacea MUCL 33604]|uniref:GST N-terminal domain-containing protein n=1 Tax=Jaapia argillacea MUCL 33604 TaxID=933084 RepID=A0A067P702_9AGAM|nr:hypothetical protein JAAARDRAFT_199937 [Jaapia argillacea MUCL 33604]